MIFKCNVLLMLNEHFMRFKLNQFSAFCPELLGQLGILCIRRAGTLLAVRVVLTGSYHVFRDRQMNACLSTLLKYKKISLPNTGLFFSKFNKIGQDCSKNGPRQQWGFERLISGAIINLCTTASQTQFYLRSQIQQNQCNK